MGYSLVFDFFRGSEEIEARNDRRLRGVMFQKFGAKPLKTGLEFFGRDTFSSGW
jgi:hypothetical protein